ncbi:MAG: DUF3127 domain-containing protein [Lepagella sp.]
MDIEGTIILDLPLQEGVSKQGNAWKKKEWVLETQGMYPRKVKFHVFGENRVRDLQFEVGKAYRISVDLESREFNGRWYTDVSAYAATPIDLSAPAAPAPMGGVAPAATQPAAPAYGQPAAPAVATPDFAQDPLGGADNNGDDLPF